MEDLAREADSWDIPYMHSNTYDDHHLQHYHQDESELQMEERNLYPVMEKSTIAVIAIMSIILLLILVLLLTAKLDMRCLTQYNSRQWDFNYDDDRGGGKDDGNIEERISYIRSIIQTVKLCTEKIEEKWYAYGGDGNEDDGGDECSQLKGIKKGTSEHEHENEFDCENQTSTTSTRINANNAQQISNLRSRSQHSSTHINVTEIIGSEEHECAICFAPYEEGDVVCFSQNKQCPHFYHVECMVSWLSRNDNYSCPSCRQDYLKNDDSTDSGSRIIIIECPEVNTTNHSSTQSSNSDGEEDGESENLLNVEQGDDGEDTVDVAVSRISSSSSMRIHLDEESGGSIEEDGNDIATDTTIIIPNGDHEHNVHTDDVIDINHVLRYGC